MLQFLQTGAALYVLAAVCVLSALSKWITRNLYKRLIKETDNMTLTKNKSLRNFKQKTESTYRLNQGISHVPSYLERQMYDFRFMGFSLNAWSGFSTQMTLLCFLLGGAAAFASYWYRSDNYYIVLYGSIGILTGLLTIFVDNGAGLSDKKQQLFISLQNYLENSMFTRLAKEMGRDEADQESVRGGGRELAKADRSFGDRAAGIERIVPERLVPERVAVERLTERSSGDHIAMERGVSERVVPERAMNERIISERNAPPVRKRGGKAAAREEEEVIAQTPTGKRDIDYLKHSLEQIAVSREKEKESRSEENWLKELEPEEVKLIGEIIREYLA